MKLITETIEDVKLLTEEKDGKKLLYIEGVFLQSELKNRNGRMYPFDVLNRALRRLRRIVLTLKIDVDLNLSATSYGHDFPLARSLSPPLVSY